MKRLLFVMMFILTISFGYSQYVKENNVLKFESIGWSGSNYIVRVTNKASCSTTVRITFSSVTNGTKDTTLDANSTALVPLQNMIQTSTDIKAKRNTGAVCITGASNEWLEIKVLQVVLPIKFKSISVRKLTNSSAQLEFESEEDNTIQKYIVKISPDGKVWKDVVILFPNGVQGLKKYSVIVNF